MAPSETPSEGNIARYSASGGEAFVVPEEVTPEQNFDPNEGLYSDIVRARAAIERTHDPERRARMERLQTAMEDVADNFQEFHKLSTDVQVNILDDLTDKLFDEDSQAQDNKAKINKARDDGRELDIQDLIREQRQRYDGLRRELAFELGIELEDDVELQDEQFRERLMDMVKGMSNASEEDIMKRLGFLIYDERKGEYRFNFPEDLFPPHIVDTWKKYEQLIVDHERASKKYDRALDDNAEEIVQLDLMRRFAHNNLARSVQHFLHLEDWDFERCRKYVQKMVEKRFPTVETSESKLTSEAVVNRLRALRSLGDILRQHHPHAS